MTNPVKLRGLTLTHPWPYAITHWEKDVENRLWHPTRWGGEVGMFLAIHGGVVPGPNSAKRRAARLELADALVRAGRDQRVNPVALQRLRQGLAIQDEARYFVPGIVAVARLSGVTRSSTSRWAAAGQYHWTLADLVVLPEPVQHTGGRGLWTLEEHALDTVRRVYRERVGSHEAARLILEAA